MWKCELSELCGGRCSPTAQSHRGNVPWRLPPRICSSPVEHRRIRAEPPNTVDQSDASCSRTGRFPSCTFGNQGKYIQQHVVAEFWISDIWINNYQIYIFKKLYRFLPVIESTTKVTVARSASCQVVTEPPVLRLQKEIKLKFRVYCLLQHDLAAWLYDSWESSKATAASET